MEIIGHNIEEVERALTEQGYRYHHWAWARGYLARSYGRDYCEVEPYEGKFGTGYKVAQPSWKSTAYHYVDYWVKEED